MELQGKKVTHDFLSLCSSDSSFQLPDPRPSSQGFFLKTRDFLRPLEEEEGCGCDVSDVPAAVTSLRQSERMLPGGVRTHAVNHVVDTAATVKASGSSRAFPIVFEAKPEPDYGSRSTTTSYGSFAGGASYTLRDEKDTVSRGKWPSHFTTARGSCGRLSAAGTNDDIATSGRNDLASERKQFMEVATSVPIRGYNRLDDEEEFGKRECSSSNKDLTVKVEAKAACNDQRPNTPRSKHSATEQRRRSKINDRFQILRGVIPHSDQKRDKASFLLEVIEYIRFLQEKVQKYELSYPECSQDDVKLMPGKLSLQQNSNQAPANVLLASHVVNNDSAAPTRVFSKKANEISIPGSRPTLISSTHNPSKTCVVSGGISYETTTTNSANNLACTHNLLQTKLFPLERETNTTQLQSRSLEAYNSASQDQCGWSESCSLADGAVISQRLNEKEELIIDEGTINVSTAYSHELLNTLTQALKSSGIDLSQANIAVQINLGKRAVKRRSGAASTTCTTNKDMEAPVYFKQAKGCNRSRPMAELSSEASKRPKTHG
ncbi:transcription factor BIM1-like [Curcuma longa]|uniref:transcription factor BIM1-like n=1 Tax=Curcuma longa TaxID=136217 RepID=UPI003D9EFF90